MKKLFVIISFFTWKALNAQSNDEKEIIQKTYLLSHTIFGTKDSLALEGLFARTATYGHSHGKIQNRGEAIDGAMHNQSFYTDTSRPNF
ncbi:MAG: hypothetical protein M3Z92_06935 [Bacteroidota bacterium]|nr:hypothetical protein [Bacteroidota bacterium]